MNINNEDVDEDNNDDEQEEEEEEEKPIPASVCIRHLLRACNNLEENAIYTEMLQKLEKALFENKYFTKKLHNF